MQWKVENKVISELFIGGINIIEPWGFETADSSAFFSLEECFGYRYQILHEEYTFDENSYKAKLLVQMPEGKWRLNIDDVIKDESNIVRKVELETVDDSYFMDFVLRFRFKKELIEYIIIDGQKYYHENSNKYYQFPVDFVCLKAKNYRIKIYIADSIIPPKMESVMYARDAENEWVIHARMIPRQWDKEVIKLCAAWAGTRPLPQWMSNYILGHKKMRDALWYRGERSPYKNRLYRKLVNPSAFGMARINKSSKLMWKVWVKIS